MNALSALLYLQLTSLQGRVRSRLRRLKQPKYLLGAVVGVAYIYFFFIHRARPGMRPGYGNQNADHVPNLPAEALPTVAALGALLLLTVVVLSWILPRAKASLAFSEAEIAFLFPAPIRRRTLIHYRLLKSQIGLAFTSLLLAFVTNRWSFLGGNAATHVVGWWIILATLSLHFTGSSFVITRLLNRGVTSWRRRLVVFGFIAVVLAATAIWIRHDVRAPDAGDLLNPRAMSEYLLAMLSSGPLPWLLTLPKLVLAPFLAPNTRAFALALAPALLVLGAHYVWVLRTATSFEDASIEKAEKRAARISAMREGKSPVGAAAARPVRAPFSLASTGRPEIAFLWKNLLSAPSLFRPRVALIAAAIIVAGCTWLVGHAAYRPMLTIVGAVALMVAAFTLALGPQIARYDLRADLLNAEILKTYPLRGWQIVFGELLTPIAILTTILWLALLAAALSSSTFEVASLGSKERVGIAIGLALLAPPFCALQLLVPNALAVLFPAWVQTVSNRGEHGLDVMGQRIVFMAGQLLAAAIALLPAAIGAALVFFVTQWLIGPIVAAAIACLVVFAVLAAEFWIGVQWLGQRFERFDLSAELGA